MREVIFVGQIAQTAQTYDLRHITPNSDTESSLNLRLQTKFNAFCKDSSQTYPYLILWWDVELTMTNLSQLAHLSVSQ